VVEGVASDSGTRIGYAIQGVDKVQVMGKNELALLKQQLQVAEEPLFLPLCQD